MLVTELHRGHRNECMLISKKCRTVRTQQQYGVLLCCTKLTSAHCMPHDVNNIMCLSQAFSASQTLTTVKCSHEHSRALACLHICTRPVTCLFCSITFAQPSAICARQIKAAWRCSHLASVISWGRACSARGTMVLPPRARAIRSRHSCPNSYKSPSPSASYCSESA